MLCAFWLMGNWWRCSSRPACQKHNTPWPADIWNSADPSSVKILLFLGSEFVRTIATVSVALLLFVLNMAVCKEVYTMVEIAGSW
jgi:hypothetical protein